VNVTWYEEGHSCMLCSKYVAAAVAQLYVKYATAASMGLHIDYFYCLFSVLKMVVTLMILTVMTVC